MAPPHHGPGAPFQSIQRQHRQRPVKRLYYLGLTHLAASTHDMPPPTVFSNCRRPLASIHLSKRGVLGHAVVEILTRASVKIVGYLPCNMHGNRRRRGEARRVEACDIEESRSIVGLPDDKIVAIGIRGPYPREVGYEPLCGKPGPCFMSELVHQLQPIGMRRYVSFTCLLNRRRANQQVSMNRWRNQHTLAGRRRNLEHRM